MIYEPSMIIKNGKEIPLESLTKEEREAFVKRATITAYRAVGYQEKNSSSSKI